MLGFESRHGNSAPPKPARNRAAAGADCRPPTLPDDRPSVIGLFPEPGAQR